MQLVSIPVPIMSSIIDLIKCLCRRGCRISCGKNLCIDVFPANLVTKCENQKDYNDDIFNTKSMDLNKKLENYDFCVESLYASTAIFRFNFNLDYTTQSLKYSYIVNNNLSQVYFRVDDLENFVFDLENIHSDKNQKNLDYIVVTTNIYNVNPIPSQHLIDYCRNNLQHIVYLNCFKFKLSLYMHLLDTFGTDMKKVILDYILRVRGWHMLDFHTI